MATSQKQFHSLWPWWTNPIKPVQTNSS